MKTSKIKEVKATKEWTSSNGTTIYHSLVMENGEKIQIGKKKLQAVGTELTYEITDEQSGEFMKAKSVAPEGFVTQKSSSAQPNVQNLIIAQSSLASACNLLSQSSKATSEEALRIAEEFYKFVMSKS